MDADKNLLPDSSCVGTPGTDRQAERPPGVQTAHARTERWKHLPARVRPTATSAETVAPPQSPDPFYVEWTTFHTNVGG